MSRKLLAAIGVFAMALVSLAIPAGANLPGTEGCTPGFWKNHPEDWAATGFSPDQTVGSVFDAANIFFPELADETLLAALSFEGGPGLDGAARILLRHAVASLLNAAHPDLDHPAVVNGVINRTNNALASGSRATMLNLKDKFEAKNTLGCPL